MLGFYCTPHFYPSWSALLDIQPLRHGGGGSFPVCCGRFFHWRTRCRSRRASSLCCTWEWAPSPSSTSPWGPSDTCALVQTSEAASLSTCPTVGKRASASASSHCWRPSRPTCVCSWFTGHLIALWLLPHENIGVLKAS